jgi:hypothetical protein
MFDDRIRSRLEALNRGPLPVSTLPAQPVQPAPAKATVSSPLRPRAVKPIQGLIQRGIVAANEAGEHLCIILPLDELWPGGADLAIRRHDQLASRPASGKPSPLQQELSHFVRAFPGDILLVDLETCGLSAAACF